MTTHVISSYFGLISYKIFTFWLIPTKTNLSRPATQNILKANQSVQMFSTTLTMIHKESFNVKPTKILSELGGRGLMAGSTFTHGCKFSFPSFPSVILEMPQASLSDMATRCLAPYFVHIIKVKFAHSHPPTIPIKHARHHNSKTRTPSWRLWHFLSAYDTSPIKAHLFTNHWPPMAFRANSSIFPTKSLQLGQSLPKQTFFRLATQNTLKANQKTSRYFHIR